MQDVRGKAVAIGLDSEYPSILDFTVDYIDDYTARTLAVYLNLGSTKDILHQIYDNTTLLFDSGFLKVRLINAFDGTPVGDYAKKLEKEQWHLGDVVEEEEGHKVMIVKDNKSDYVLMDIGLGCANAFRVSEFFECSSSLRRLRGLSHNWRKVVED